MRLRRGLVLLTGLLVVLGGARPASADSQLLGAGSTYVGQAMSQWVGDGQNLGLRLDYQAVGSPTGLSFYTQNQADFAGTEAEFRSIYGDQHVRSYQYVPDVAGATAMMYNVRDAAGRRVDYLHLSPHTIAAIFTGKITSWNDPVIRAENLGTQFESRPIHVILRSGQSGTTALFYDFVQHAAPELWAAFRARNQLPSGARVVEIPETAIAGATAVGSSDLIAQTIANDASGAGAIGYDEFGYAKFFHVPVAWVQNAAGRWVQPYAVNISAALDGATLRPDLSQELSTVYSNRNPLAYPASAYSYLVTPCAPTRDRATCTGPYAPGQVATMAAWLNYIGCQGQVKMAQLGYSPLPPVLSQEVQKAIARLGPGAPPARALNAGNCANPRFTGGLGVGAASPPDPFAKVDARFKAGGTGTPTTSGARGATGAAPGGGQSSGAARAAGGAARAPGAAVGTPGGPAAGGVRTPGTLARGPGTPEPGAAAGPASSWREDAPAALHAPAPKPVGALPGLALVLLLGLPVAARALRRRR